MNIGFPQINRQDIKENILRIFDKIRNKKYIRDVFILKDINVQLENLDQDEKQKIIEFMIQEFEGEQFLVRGGYFNKPDYKELYQSTRQQKNKTLMFELLKNQKFIEDNQISELISMNHLAIQMLDEKIFDLLDLNEYKLGKKLISQIELLQILISFLFLPQQERHSQNLEQIVGSLLKSQINQFIFYLKNKENANQDSYDQFVNLLKQRQLFLITLEEFEIQIENMNDYKFFKIINPIIQGHQVLRQYINQRICNLLQCSQFQMDDLLLYIQNVENVNEELEELYFCIIFYFWMNYLIKFEIQQGLDDLKKIYMEDQNEREEVIQQIIQEQVKSSQDEILLFFVHVIFYFQTDLQLQISQSYLDYQEKVNKLKQEICGTSIILSQDIWQLTSQLQFCQLKEIKDESGLINFFWITSFNSELFEIIEQIQERQQNLNLVQAKQQLEIKLQNTQLKSKQLIIKNILISLPGNLQFVDRNHRIQFIKFYFKFNTSNEKVLSIIEQIFLSSNNNQLNQTVIQLCENLYDLDEAQYEVLLRSVQYLNIFQLKPQCLKRKKLHKQFPKVANIAIEQFRFLAPEEHNQYVKQAIKKWVNCMDANQTYDLFQIFLDILKRGETFESLIEMINEEIASRHYQLKSECFNIKALFQIFYNNSNQELKYLLLKYYSQQYPVPFIYQTYNFDCIQNEEDLFQINDKLFYLMQDSINIINLSLSKIQTKIGKTELINNIFYKLQKFEIGDNCQLNGNTIDLMFDFEFNKTRNFMVADAHGYVPQEVLIKILPLFQLWIVQIDTEKELQENLVTLTHLMNNSNYKKVCLLIRNSTQIQLLQEFQNQLDELNIAFHQVLDLAEKGIGKQIQLNEIQKASKFIFNQINNIEVNKSDDLYLKILKNFNSKSHEISETIQQNKNLFDLIFDQLSIVVEQPDGFYNKDTFPLRHSDYRNKILENDIIYQSLQPQKEKEIKRLQEEIQYNNMFKKFREPSELLKLFQQVLKQDHTQYLWFLEKLKQFDEENTQKLTQKYQNLIQGRSSQIKLSGQFTSSNYLDQTIQSQDVRIQIKEIENELKLKKIGIEIFWRELIQFESLGKQLDIDPIEALCQIIRKGEPFELLDSDLQNIDQQFLRRLIRKLNQNENQKILVLSVLGPQSSGKSTLLNKIFGCHFWASVGRCTKGINMQLVKVRDDSIFGSIFDQILLLDTEGLQSPNQADAEFDQKMSLLILAISDIILLTVKGDIHSQFHNLIEICVYQYGQLVNNIAGVKQIIWCFNQNNDIQRIGPFFEQIQQLATNLDIKINQNNQIGQSGKQNQNQQIDYTSIIEIDIKHIWVLGFAQIQNVWNDQRWTQSKINETFSFMAYQNAIKMIKNYIEKFKLQDDVTQLQSLSQYLTSVEEMWNSIQRLPDYIEFQELLQYYQNKQMKDEYNNILEQKSDDFKFKYDIKAQIQHSARINQITDQFLNQLEQDKMNEVNIKLKVIQEQIYLSLQNFSQTKKISRQVFLKFQTQLNKQIDNEQLMCRLIITEGIINQKIEYRKVKILEDLAERFRNSYEVVPDKNQVQTLFNKEWKTMLKQFSETLEYQFDSFEILQYQTMKGQYNEFVLISKREPDYLTFFKSNLNKTEAHISKEKQIQLFQLYFEELKETQFRPIFRTDQHFSHFNKTIQQKILETFEPNYINFSKFYICQIRIEYLKKDQLLNYLNEYFMNNQLIQINNIKKILSLFNHPQLKVDNKFQQLLEQIQKQLQNNEKITKEIKKSIQIIDDYQNFPQEILKGLQTYEEKIQVLGSNAKSYINQMQENNLIISEEINCQFNEQEYQEYQIFFQQLETQQLSKNPNQFSKSFNSLMISEKGWEQIYDEIYQFILLEMSDKQNIIERQDEQIKSYKMQQVSVLIDKLNVNLIQNKFNKQFASFGVTLNLLGQRCIIYFSLLIIWSLTCQQQWQSANKIQKQLEESKDHQFDKIFADLSRNDDELSKISARDFFGKIRSNFQLQFYDKNRDFVRNQIQKINFNPLETLDQKLFQEDADKTFIVNYIVEQSNQVEQEAKSQIDKFKDDLISELNSKLNQEYQSLKEKILQNANLLNRFMKPGLKNEDYFQNTGADLKVEMHSIVLRFLQGQDPQNTGYINYYQRYIFQQIGKQEVQIPWNNRDIVEIYRLDVFIKELILTISENTLLEIDLTNFQVEEELYTKQLQIIGCREYCQFCKRKCDLEVNHKSRHKCQKGHFLGGLELRNVCCDEFFVGGFRRRQEFNVNIQGWDFQTELDKSKKLTQKKKLIKIWNNYGQEICQRLQIDFRNIPEQQIHQQIRIHYIFILDSSGSMDRDWTSIKQGVRQCIDNIKVDDLENNSNAKISLILFNDKATVLKKAERAARITKKIKMNFLGGTTDFSKPIKKAIKIIQQDNTSELYLLLFYTDGRANKPEDELNKIRNLNQDKKEKIYLVACTQDNNYENRILNQIVQCFQENTGRGELISSFSADHMIQLWQVIVNFRLNI